MFRLITTSLVLIVAGLPTTIGQSLLAQNNRQSQTNPNIHLHWGARRRVVRYRLQIANDPDFHDIVLDVVITGTQTDINDLPPGKYFWRIAALTRSLGEFSSVGVIETSPE